MIPLIPITENLQPFIVGISARVVINGTEVLIPFPAGIVLATSENDARI